MADLVKQTLPYELLVRWDEKGHLSGASYSTRVLYRDGDEVVLNRIVDPVPVAMGDNGGFPLAEVLSSEHIDAVASVNAANAERDAAVAEVERLEAEVQRLSPRASEGDSFSG